MVVLGTDFGLAARFAQGSPARPPGAIRGLANGGELGAAGAGRGAAGGFPGHRLEAAQRHRTARSPQSSQEPRASDPARLPAPASGRPSLRTRIAPARCASRVTVRVPSAALPAHSAPLGREAEREVAAVPAAWRAICPAPAPARAAAAAASRAPTCGSPGVRAPAGEAGERERGRASGGGGRNSPHP